MGALTLGRLIDRDRLAELVAAARAIAPALHIRVVDDGAPNDGAERRPIVVDGHVLGAVVAGGAEVDPGLARAHAEVLRPAVERPRSSGPVRSSSPLPRA